MTGILIPLTQCCFTVIINTSKEDFSFGASLEKVKVNFLLKNVEMKVRATRDFDQTLMINHMIHYGVPFQILLVNEAFTYIYTNSQITKHELVFDYSVDKLVVHDMIFSYKNIEFSEKKLGDY